MSELENKVILLTGGTGSFGVVMTRLLLTRCKPKAIRIFSRDEFKQYRCQQYFQDERLRFLLGDVRDRNRLRRACEGVDIIFHAAALKQVPACEYNPFEAIQTNIIGAVNIVDAAIDCGVEKVLALSTDKAVCPVNLYGATKLCAEKVFIHGNSYTGRRGVKFACVRYGNVIGSRGSVLPLFLEQRAQNKLTLTDRRMTRFWITLKEATSFVLKSLDLMAGGEVFVPKIPSMKIVDLARVIAPEAEIKEVGVRPGEKLHETLIMKEESHHAFPYEDLFIILPEWFPKTVERPYRHAPLKDDFEYSSEKNTDWLHDDAIRKLVADFEAQSKTNQPY